MLCFENVRKVYKDFELNCSMRVEPGCITGLIGPNGAGKSTAFKAALGLIRTDGGRMEILGKPADQLLPSDREQIGVVLADSGFSRYLRIKELLPVLDHLYHGFSREEFKQNCRKLSLPMDKKIGEFSTGMKRKLQLLAAVSHDADLLILDEPTSGLDVIARDQLLGLLREYMEKDGRSILISSHISADLEGFCDDVYLIDQGRIILHEETDNLLNRYGLLKVTPEQYAGLDQAYILKSRREDFGYSCLTDQKQFYVENYPNIVIERGSIDELIMMMNGRES
ncbi:ABC transporter ATP-binding protein [Merdimonas faecis]|uniref:ABC transporter ATP-binding protein n=1 Tax=Merdimonas faecis TaxID=1653435 RepID=UPI0023F98251|nr:ABC transporter ATP-binding protein [Merdimonas faecis]